VTLLLENLRHGARPPRRRQRPEEARAALSEQEIQAAIAAHFAWRARPNIWWGAIPNGGLRSKIEAAILRGQGVRAGAPDLLIVADGRAYFLEVKTEGGRLSPVQLECHEELRRAGAEVGIAYGLDHALRQLEHWRLLRGRSSAQHFIRNTNTASAGGVRISGSAGSRHQAQQAVRVEDSSSSDSTSFKDEAP
jgi:VRR-NUC domain